MSQLTTISAVRSMTGQGHAEHTGELGTIVAEVRTVNHRGFKCLPRTSESLSKLESQIEVLARKMIRRGVVHLSVVWQQPPGEGLPNIDAAALESYYAELKEVRDRIGSTAPIDLTSLLTLPGVLSPNRHDRDDDEPLWSAVRQAVISAVEDLNQMRSAEGEAMAASLKTDCDEIRDRLQSVARLSPLVIEHYRTRLRARIERALVQEELQVAPAELIREVQIFADRTDISEELTRLDSHLQMFASTLGGSRDEDGQAEPTGRKLDFIIQEMFRETNTIGSKAAHAEISSHVVEIKCAIERMRELVQNLE